ncbi:MAG: 30S ribosomal protein S5 [Holosporaceae bacterium]|jgi:small subunit ribosomal protein S5|nr:30S ribosomal protein S5 [Holosporaceae bacterium]
MGREETAYIEKLVAINRVAKVVKGGKRFSFSALVIVGDGKGRVGYANGKAREVADAVKKASERAKRFMTRIPMREGRTLHHDSHGRFGAGKVVLRSATSGTGIIAGGAMRSVFEALGMQDVVSKCLGTTNPHNMVRATFNALSSVASPKYIANKRGKKINEIISRRGSIK